MKNLWILPALLLFAAPLNAVVITCVNEGNNVVRIDYDAADETSIPVAFALDITVDSGAIIVDIYDYKVGDSNKSNPGFGIFPGSMKHDENGRISDWGTPVSSGLGTSRVTVEMASRYAGAENAPPVRGTLCKILIDPRGAGAVNVGVAANGDGGGIILENATAAKFNAVGTILGLRVNKCTVTAGSIPTSDSIWASGFIDVAVDEFLVPGSIVVTVNSEYMVNPCVRTFPIDGDTFRNGKYECSKTENSSKTSFTFDSMTSKFSFIAKYVSLKGLSCPLSIEIKIGDYTSASNLDEAIVNGARRPIPIKLMMGVKDSLKIDRARVVRSTRRNGDRLTVKGGFAVEHTDVNMVNEDFFATLGSQTFTIPANSFKATRNGFTCSRIMLSDGSIAAANFNFSTGAFTLTVKNTQITAGAGNVDLGLKFAGFNQVEQINIP